MKRKSMLCKAVSALLVALIAQVIPGAAVRAETGTMPQALYWGVATQNLTIRSERSREAEGVGHCAEGERVYITAYEPEWLTVVKGTADSWVTGYLLRHTVFDIVAIDAGAALPYGATPASYSCVTTKDVGLYAEPNRTSEQLELLTSGTRIAVLDIQDGWASVIYRRQYGYFYIDAATELTPVYDTATAQAGDLIGAFISFFSQSQSGLNPNRIINIGKACEYIRLQLEPGESFSFNGIAGPYLKTRGYLEAPSFVAGETVPSNGGGTCQVSSTLYNVLLPLTDGMTILYRVAHGAGGAAYLPHGVDAACGNERIDLQFRNDYAFPVQIDASEHDGVLYIELRKAA